MRINCCICYSEEASWYWGRAAREVSFITGMRSNPVSIPWVQSATQHILILAWLSRTAWRILLSASLRSWRLMSISKKAPEQERHKSCYHQNSRCSNTSSWQGHIYTIIIVNYYGWLDSITNHIWELTSICLNIISIWVIIISFGLRWLFLQVNTN